MAETFHLPHVSSYKLFIFCDVLHETKQKRRQILESAHWSTDWKSSLTALKKTTEQKYIKKGLRLVFPLHFFRAPLLPATFLCALQQNRAQSRLLYLLLVRP